MKPNQAFYAYLKKIRSSVDLFQLHSDTLSPDLIALRHDIDHDLDIALDFAYWEQREGIKATFFIIHDHDYNNDPYFWEKLLQLQDYGHEVGVHLNLIAGWLLNRYSDPLEHLRDWLSTAAKKGVRIRGAATHGDKICYEYAVLNSWLFQEQRHKAKLSISVSAEGIPDPRKEYSIPPRVSDELIRDDGSCLKLWSHSAKKLGLEYEAVDIPSRYWSDTGKKWLRTGNPLEHDLSSGRHQILMHPIHWLSAPRKIFILSTARAGSKWTAETLNHSSSADVLHEWTLNHRQRNGSEVNEKITTLENTTLTTKPRYTEKLIQYASRQSSSQTLDRVEFNVYLADHVDSLLESFPNAEIYGLIRNAQSVIPSLLSRDWYASPNTRRHPNNKKYAERSLSQFEKCCHYWRETNESIVRNARRVFRLEDLTKNKKGFESLLREMQLPVHPRLLKLVDRAPKDQTKSGLLAASKFWPHETRQKFLQVCGELQQANDYSNRFKFDISAAWYFAKKTIDSRFTKQPFPIRNEQPIKSPLLLNKSNLGYTNLDINEYVQGLKLTVSDPAKTAYVVLPGSTISRWNWHDDARSLDLPRGIRVLDIFVKFTASSDCKARLFLLEYDADTGELVNKRHLTNLISGWSGKASELITISDKLVSLGIFFDRKLNSLDKPNILIKDIELNTSEPKTNYLFSLRSP